MSRSFPVPGIVCPVHGDQPGLTRCRWCSWDPLKNRIRRPDLLPGDDVLARSEESRRSSFPLDLAHDQFQSAADVLEA